MIPAACDIMSHAFVDLSRDVSRGGSCRWARHRLLSDKNYGAREEIISQTLTLRLTDTAEADLAEIWAYLATKATNLDLSKVEKKSHFPHGHIPGHHKCIDELTGQLKKC